jgi:hypothetical protein
VSVLQLARGAFWALAALALAACNGSRSFDGSFGPLQSSAHIITARGAVLDRSGGVSRMGAAPGRSGGPSWMDPEAKAGDLMYVSSYPDDAVYVYTYPALKKAGKLTYLSYPDGICTDKKGNVFVVNNRPGKGIVEYAHGGKTPIAQLDDGAEYAVSCDVDPVTGNVAVSNYASYSYDPGSVAIYPKAQNTPVYYTDPNISVMLFCGYDDKGNLFVDGLTPAYENFFAELPKGKSKFTFIDVKGGASQFGYPGTIRWDGTHVVVGNQRYEPIGSSYYDSAIEITTGAGGKILKTIVLKGSTDVQGFAIDGKTLIGADVSLGLVAFYPYPGNGKPSKKLTGFRSPPGVAISKK